MNEKDKALKEHRQDWGTMRDAYLARLGIATVEAPTKAFLRKLQRAHAQTIPYENLDVLAGRTISLDVDALFRKLIVGRRGGYCF